jgi:RimJ/RimL family protein N-acetyltransferase
MTEVLPPRSGASTLLGRIVRLEPLTEAHREALRPLAQEERIWTTSLTHGLGPAFDTWFDAALRERDSGRRLPFAVRTEDRALVGSSSYLDVTPEHRRVEIGATWYHPGVWGTAVNPECKLLLLGHAFDVMRVNRVALITDALNLRSQAAIAKLGAVREGVLRSDRITQGGRVRDSVVFSILAPEWPQVRTRLEQRLVAFERHGSGLA